METNFVYFFLIVQPYNELQQSRITRTVFVVVVVNFYTTFLGIDTSSCHFFFTSQWAIFREQVRVEHNQCDIELPFN